MEHIGVEQAFWNLGGELTYAAQQVPLEVSLPAALSIVYIVGLFAARNTYRKACDKINASSQTAVGKEVDRVEANFFSTMVWLFSPASLAAMTFVKVCQIANKAIFAGIDVKKVA